MKVEIIHPSRLNVEQVAQVLRVIRDEMKGTTALPWAPMDVEADFFGLHQHLYLAVFEEEKLRALAIIGRAGADTLQVNNQWGDIDGWKEAMYVKLAPIAKELNCKFLQFYSQHGNGLKRMMAPLGFDVQEELYFYRKEIY